MVVFAQEHRESVLSMCLQLKEPHQEGGWIFLHY